MKFSKFFLPINSRLAIMVLAPTILSGTIALGLTLLVINDIAIMISDTWQNSPKLPDALNSLGVWRSIVFLMSCAGILITGLVGSLIAWKTGGQFDAIKSSIKILAGGDLDTPVLFSDDGPIGSLGNTLEKMRLLLQEKLRLQIAEESSKRTVDKLSLLLDLSQVATNSPNLPSALRILAQKTAKELNASGCLILISENEREFTPVAFHPGVLRSNEKKPVSLEFSPLLSLDGIPDLNEISNNNPAVFRPTNEQTIQFPLLSEFPEGVSLCAVPLFGHGVIIGMMIIGGKQNGFEETTINVAQAIANQISSAVANSRLFEMERERRQTSETLHFISEITTSLDASTVVDRLLEGLHRLIPYTSATLIRQNTIRPNGLFAVIGSKGYKKPSELMGKTFTLHSIPFINDVALSKEPMTLNNTRADARITASNAVLFDASSVLFPFFSKGDKQTVLIVNSNQPDYFSLKHLGVLEMFARIGAIALENAILHKKANFLVTTDGLTSVFNRRHFMERVEVEIHRFQRTGRPLSFVLFDIDHFKDVNDFHGHAVVDEVLVTIVQRSSSLLRELDIIGRLGSEEFAILLPETDPSDATMVADRIRSIVSNAPLILDKDGENVAISITVSIGVSSVDDRSTVQSLYNKADRALCRAKDSDRNRVGAFLPM